MDFTFLPSKANLKNRTFARYTISGYNSSFNNNKGRAAYSHNGFYYIGKSADNIDKLVRVFKRGYASDILENAKFELKRSLEQEKNVIPEIIFCEGHFDFVAIKSFSQFLKNHPVLSAIPFVIDANGLSEKELNNFKKNKLPDEIIFLEDYDEKNLLAKGQFLKKVKSQVSKLEARNGIKSSSQESPVQYVIKRTFDILISSLALLVVSPLFILIALAVKIESRGPIFYISKRAGRGYGIFNFYKFRTMHVGSDEKMADFAHLNQYNANPNEGPVFFKISNDPRITKVGTFLRNSSLDELPQLLNVLLGDMSLVGNRPLPLYEAVNLTTDEWAKRFMAPAGITGLWQIKKRGKTDMSVEERISLDIDYANNYNFVYDLWIMANTPSALIQKANA
jgi:lipopolysaccharide/colanic/teichoic acid biosynthesis glycosyltransferase